VIWSHKSSNIEGSAEPCRMSRESWLLLLEVTNRPKSTNLPRRCWISSPDYATHVMETRLSLSLHHTVQGIDLVKNGHRMRRNRATSAQVRQRIAVALKLKHAMPKYPLPVLVQVVAEPRLRPWDPINPLVRKGIGKRCQVFQIPQLSMSCQFLTACDFKLQVHFS